MAVMMLDSMHTSCAKVGHTPKVICRSIISRHYTNDVEILECSVQAMFTKHPPNRTSASKCEDEIRFITFRQSVMAVNKYRCYLKYSANEEGYLCSLPTSQSMPLWSRIALVRLTTIRRLVVSSCTAHRIACQPTQKPHHHEQSRRSSRPSKVQ